MLGFPQTSAVPSVASPCPGCSQQQSLTHCPPSNGAHTWREPAAWGQDGDRRGHHLALCSAPLLTVHLPPSCLGQGLFTAEEPAPEALQPFLPLVLTGLSRCAQRQECDIPIPCFLAAGEKHNWREQPGDRGQQGWTVPPCWGQGSASQGSAVGVRAAAHALPTVSAAPASALQQPPACAGPRPQPGPAEGRDPPAAAGQQELPGG